MEKAYEITLNDEEKAMLQKTIGLVRKTVEETKLQDLLPIKLIRRRRPPASGSIVPNLRIHHLDAMSLHRSVCRQLIQEGLRLDKIRRGESFREPRVDLL